LVVVVVAVAGVAMVGFVAWLLANRGSDASVATDLATSGSPPPVATSSSGSPSPVAVRYLEALAARDAAAARALFRVDRRSIFDRRADDFLVEYDFTGCEISDALVDERVTQDFVQVQLVFPPSVRARHAR
jgi:hypothetical protein